MQGPEKNSYKEFDNKKKFLQLENSPPPHNFSNGPSLTILSLDEHLYKTNNRHFWNCQRTWLFFANTKFKVFFSSEKSYAGNPGFHRLGPMLGPIQFSLEYSLRFTIVMHTRVGSGTLSLSLHLWSNYISTQVYSDHVELKIIFKTCWKHVNAQTSLDPNTVKPC